MSGYVARKFAFGFIVLLVLFSHSALALGPAEVAALSRLSSSDKQQLLDMARQSGLAGGSVMGLPKRQAAKSELSLGESAQAETALKKSPASEELIPRIEPADTIIVYFTVPEVDVRAPARFVADEVQQYEPHSPIQMFMLDRHGMMDLPGIGKIALAGLTEDEAAARINLEPHLQRFTIIVKRLPLEPMGKKALKPFGYDLFRKESLLAQQQAISHVPVPGDYTVGPGDIIYIQLFGKENQEYGLEVSRDGTLIFPGVGSIPVAGLTFKQLKTDLSNRITKL